jgi:hypothetical protein
VLANQSKLTCSLVFNARTNAWFRPPECQAENKKVLEVHE